jgi:serine/threonine protein kinase
LYDYGVDDENYWLVMKYYICSLRAWRKRQTRSLKENLPLYLNVFMCVLNTMQFLGDHNTNHYDLKCDNFLLQPLHKSIPEEEIFNQPTSTPNFTVALADFGEAKIYPPGPENEALQYTFRNRGTEYIKSPEMLMAAYSNRKGDVAECCLSFFLTLYQTRRHLIGERARAPTARATFGLWDACFSSC